VSGIGPGARADIIEASDDSVRLWAEWKRNSGVDESWSGVGLLMFLVLLYLLNNSSGIRPGARAEKSVWIDEPVTLGSSY
jgi:hypothetical protein